MTKAKKSGLLTRVVLAASVFLLAANALLGFVLMKQSAAAVRLQIQKRMLDVSKSAAAMLDGNVLARLSEQDVGTPPYEAAKAVLRTFEEQTELAYIYAVRDMGDGTYVFLIDPSPTDPGKFGERVRCTEALRAAGEGTPSVDKSSYEDRWGRFYSAYCPVLDARGRVAGIVAADFDAAQYERQIGRQIVTIFVGSVLSLLFGGMVVYFATSRFHRRLTELDQEMDRLTDDMEDFAAELRLASGQSRTEAEAARGRLRRPGSGAAIEDLAGVIQSVRAEMRQYIADAHEMAYTDAMTGVGNRAAYLDEAERMNRQIAEGTAAFSLALFDVNSLKRVNDAFGHEYGDKLILDAAVSLRDIFGEKSVYRIGGDEFAVILQNTSPEDAGGLFQALEEKIAAMPLAISKGAAEYRRDEDKSFGDVFRRADEEMYRDKSAYYAEHGDRRRKGQ